MMYPIHSASIQMHNQRISLPIQPKSLSEEEQIGILEIEMSSTPANPLAQEITMTIDISGSMNEKCQDRKTKLDHVLHTTKNIIDLLSTMENTNISIQIILFDDQTENMCEMTHVKDTLKIKEIKEKIDKLQPRNGTDIELSLNYANKNRKKPNPCKQNTYLHDRRERNQWRNQPIQTSRICIG